MLRREARAILHVDMDAFYASVEEHDRPELKGRPLIVGGTGGRGVVAAASYAVRRFGVHSAMPMREAIRLCPQAVCVRPRMARYQEVSAQVFDIFHRFTPLVEGLSLDEAFLDVSDSRRLLGEPVAIGTRIRALIAQQTGLTASVGVAPNKLLAKIASDLHKPDAICSIDTQQVRALLDPLPIQKLFGVGSRSLPSVQAAGIYTFRDAREADEATLRRAFGRHGRIMRERAGGIDERPVLADRLEKSISAEETFEHDICDEARLQSLLVGLADRTASRLRAHQLSASTVTLKIRRADFATYSRQRTLRTATHDTAVIALAARDLLRAWFAGHPGAALRLLGVGVGQLRELRQADLFGTQDLGRAGRIDRAVDDIRDRFGAASLTRASLLTAACREDG